MRLFGFQFHTADLIENTHRYYDNVCCVLLPVCALVTAVGATCTFCLRGLDAIQILIPSSLNYDSSNVDA